MTEVVHEGVVVPEGVPVHEELVVNDGVVAHDAVVAQPTPEYAPTFEVDTQSRTGWPRRERWAGSDWRASSPPSQDRCSPPRPPSVEPAWLGLTATISAVWFICLRRSARFGQERELKPIVAALIGTVTGAAAISLLNFWILDLVISPRELIAMAACVFLLSAGFQAVVALGLSRRRRIVLVEPDNETRALIRELRQERDADYECVGVVEDGISPNGVPFLGGTGNLIAVLRRDRPDVLVCSADSHARTVDRLLDAGMTSVHVLDTLEFQESALHRVESRSVSPAWFASVLDINRQNYSAHGEAGVRHPRRIVRADRDPPASARHTSAHSPLRAWPGALSADADRRVRRAVRDAEVSIHGPQCRERRSGLGERERSPVTTGIGRVLRLTRLDELPQLWNVVRGEMSIVGPRPERPEFLAVLGEHVPFWSRRDLLKPGITGWAQVHFAYTADISGAATKLSYDLYYLKHRSLALDAWIVLKTFRVLLTRSGAR